MSAKKLSWLICILVVLSVLAAGALFLPWFLFLLSRYEGISTGRPRSVDEIEGVIEGARRALAAEAAEFGRLAEAFLAVQAGNRLFILAARPASGTMRATRSPQRSASPTSVRKGLTDGRISESDCRSSSIPGLSAKPPTAASRYSMAAPMR